MKFISFFVHPRSLQLFKFSHIIYFLIIYPLMWEQNAANKYRSNCRLFPKMNSSLITVKNTVCSTLRYRALFCTNIPRAMQHSLCYYCRKIATVLYTVETVERKTSVYSIKERNLERAVLVKSMKQAVVLAVIIPKIYGCLETVTVTHGGATSLGFGAFSYCN